MKICNQCGMTLRGMEGEGDICLTCLSSLTPHCSFDQGYSTIEGAIRQSTKQPIEKMKIEITPKKKANNKMWNGKPTNFSIKQSLEVVWEAIHEWNEQATDKEYHNDAVKLGMAWIMEELGYGYDKDGEIEKEERPI